MVEALDTLELAAALDDDVPKLTIDDRPKTINDLSNDVLVSVFEAVGDLCWVRRTMPLVCKAWAELYRSEDASPLHETLEVSFGEEEERARAVAHALQRPLRAPVFHGSRVISWVERRAGSVRELHLNGFYQKLEDSELISSEDLRTLVAVAGSSLTKLWIRNLYDLPEPEPFWESMRDSVALHGQLRSFFVNLSLADASESDVEPLGQLAGSLEELVLSTFDFDDPELFGDVGDGLPCFPESFCALTELRRLVLYGHPRITAIPAQISSLKKLKEIDLCYCNLSSLPKELGELSGLTKLGLSFNMDLGNAPQDVAFPAELGKMKSLRHLDLSCCGLRTVPAFVGELEALENLHLSNNEDLGDAPQDEAFPAALGRMKSLRVLGLGACGLRAVPAFVGELEALEDLSLSGNWNLGDAPQGEAFPAALGRMKSLRVLVLGACGLRAVPAFVGELESLEILDLSWADKQIYATLDFLIESCPCLREVRLYKRSWTPEELAYVGAFEAKLLAKDPDAKVLYDR